MTAIACLVLVALSCMRQSERVRTTMTSVEQLGGHVQLRWSGPRALERLGLDIYLQRWKVVDGIVLRSRRLKDPDVSRLKSILDDNPQLARLDLRHTGLADAQVVSLPAVPSLLFLDLSGNPIDGTVLGRAEILRSVETLFVEQSESDNFEVPATSQCVSLRELYLYGTVIGDRSLARMQQFNQLKWVCIRGSKVSSSGIERLEEAKPDLCVAR